MAYNKRPYSKNDVPLEYKALLAKKLDGMKDSDVEKLIKLLDLIECANTVLSITGETNVNKFGAFSGTERIIDFNPTNKTLAIYRHVKCGSAETECEIDLSNAPLKIAGSLGDEGNIIKIDANGKPIFANVYTLPDMPTVDGNYHIKCVVADGVATVSWELDQ